MNSHEQNQSAGNGEMSSGAGIHRQPVTKEYSLIAISVGFILLLFALLVVMTGVDLPYKRLLVYAGVAALFSGIGATAAVKLDLKEQGQVGVAGGAAAIAILLCLLIGPDQMPEVPKISMTYYVNFPDGKIRSPEDLTATVLVTNENESPRDLGGVPISWAPGGNVIKLTLMNLPVRDFITLKVRSIKENKTWTSASVMLTESFMILNEGK
jgi:hypothetical protein